MKDIQVKDNILLATLPNVIFDGWTDDAMQAGAEEAGYDAAMAVRAFPYGVSDLLAHFADYVNREMASRLEQEDLSNMGIGQRLENAMRIRLDIEGPYQEAVRKAMSYYAMPKNAGAGMQVIYKAVDEMWWCCGDESVDFNFYTKRASLGAVYSATMLYWINDDSDGFEETILFYRRRLIDVINAVKTRKKIMGQLSDLFRKATCQKPNVGLLKR